MISALTRANDSTTAMIASICTSSSMYQYEKPPVTAGGYQFAISKKACQCTLPNTTWVNSV